MGKISTVKGITLDIKIFRKLLITEENIAPRDLP